MRPNKSRDICSVMSGGIHSAMRASSPRPTAHLDRHDNGVALDEFALVDQHALRDLPQHE
jgi:hypothetical protein